MDLERLLSLLSNVHLSPSVPDAKAWIMSSSGAFLVNTIFSALSNFSDSIPFYLGNFLWKSKVPSKVKVFVWL